MAIKGIAWLHPDGQVRGLLADPTHHPGNTPGAPLAYDDAEHPTGPPASCCCFDTECCCEIQGSEPATLTLTTTATSPCGCLDGLTVTLTKVSFDDCTAVPPRFDYVKLNETICGDAGADVGAQCDGASLVDVNINGSGTQAPIFTSIPILSCVPFHAYGTLVLTEAQTTDWCGGGPGETATMTFELTE